MLHTSREGFSLFELLIYIALIAIVTIIIISTFLSITRGSGQSQARSEVNAALRFALQRMEQDLKFAKSVTTPATANSTSTNLVLVASGTTVTYSVTGGNLQRQSTTTDVLNSSNVVFGAPLFARLENTNTGLSKTIVSIQIQLNASYSGTSPDWQYTESKVTTVSLR